MKEINEKLHSKQIKKEIMRLSYQNKCGYRKQSWNNVYYPIVSYLYIISILLSILAERWFPSFRQPIDIAMYTSNLFLIVYCIGTLRKECQEDKTLNITTCIYILVYIAAMFILHYLLNP